MEASFCLSAYSDVAGMNGPKSIRQAITSKGPEGTYYGVHSTGDGQHKGHCDWIAVLQVPIHGQNKPTGTPIEAVSRGGLVFFFSPEIRPEIATHGHPSLYHRPLESFSMARWIDGQMATDAPLNFHLFHLSTVFYQPIIRLVCWVSRRCPLMYEVPHAVNPSDT